MDGIYLDDELVDIFYAFDDGTWEADKTVAKSNIDKPLSEMTFNREPSSAFEQAKSKPDNLDISSDVKKSLGNMPGAAKALVSDEPLKQSSKFSSLINNIFGRIAGAMGMGKDKIASHEKPASSKVGELRREMAKTRSRSGAESQMSL